MNHNIEAILARKKPEPEQTMTLWAVVTPDGEIMPDSISKVRHNSEDYVWWLGGFNYLKRRGYTCRQFNVTFKERK